MGENNRPRRHRRCGDLAFHLHISMFTFFFILQPTCVNGVMLSCCRLVLAMSRILQTVLLDGRNYASIISLVCFVASSAVLTFAGFLQMLTWRGLALKIQSFIQPFLNEEVNCQAVKTRWRVMGSCMHQASQTFQVVSTVMGMTTVLGSVAFLYDLQQSLLLTSLPGFLLCLLMPAFLLPAALAS